MADNHAKTALFLCKCGTNLSSCVDLDALEQWARTRDDVDVVACHNLLCSPDGAKFFKDTLAEHNPGHVVVAACSPKMHEKTFRGLAEEAGVNMGCVHMANIREQCGWVTPDMIQATEKADRLIAAALHRVQLSGHLARQTMACVCDVLVVGGGIAGIEAALMAARAGKHVYIVERDIALGGEVAKTEEIAPKMECGPCLLAPRLAEVRDNPNITVFSNAEIVEAKGFYGNFTVTVKKRARYVEDSCIGCEACFEVCPVEAPNAFHLGLGNRKAIHTLFIGAVPAAAAIDANRCLHFTGGSCEACVEACPFGAVNFAQQDETIEVHVGAVIVATGAMPNNPGAIESLGYGTIENVYTLPEFERLASSNGPTGGAVQLRNGTKPASVAVIHCAGSLQDGGLAYCSSTCCLGAMKVGELLRHQVPDAAVVNVHGDIVMTGPAEHAFLRKQREAGTRFVACRDLTSVRLTQNGDQIRVSGGGFDPFDADMVVLATGKRPASGTQALADLFALDIDANGFIVPDHPYLHETGASLDGIYLAGSAAGPCDIGESVTRAQAAAGDIVSRLVPGREIELEIMTSNIDEDRCAGCKLCIAVCPYKAISFDPVKLVSRVNEAICRGCGTCAAACPSGACHAKHFTDDEVYAEIGGLLHG